MSSELVNLDKSPTSGTHLLHHKPSVLETHSHGSAQYIHILYHSYEFQAEIF